MLYKLQPGKTPGVDGLPAELHRRLPLNLKRHLAARLCGIAIGKTDVPPDWANLVHPLYKKGNWARSDNWRSIVCATTEAKLMWMLILKRVASAVYRAVPPTMWGAIPGSSPLEANFLQDAVVNVDPISLIITSLDVKGAFPNNPHRLLRAVWEHMGLLFQGFPQAYLATRMYAIKTDVGTTPWVLPASGVLQGGAEGPFLFLLVTLPLAFYIRRTYPDVAPYPLRTTLLAFADDMAVVTATARQPLPTTPDTSRATKVLHIVTTYLESNQLLVHNVKSATMVHNAPPPPLRPGEPPMNPVNTATYLGVQQAATAGGVTLPPKPDTAADTDTGHSKHHGTLHPGPGILPTSCAQRSYRIPGLAPNAPPTHAASGRYHSATSVDHPRPPAHIATCNGTRGLATVLRRQHRSPRHQRVHSSHCGQPASSHAQSRAGGTRGLHADAAGGPIPSQHLPPITYFTSAASPPRWGPAYGTTYNSCCPTISKSCKRTIGAGKPAIWRSFAPMWGVDQREAPPLWTWWAPPSTSCGSPQTRYKPSKEWAHTTSHSYNTRSGPTNHSWRTTCAVRPPKPGTAN